MKIQNNYNNQTNFKGYDTRKLQGFVMNSNFGNLAADMKKIGEIENFKVYLFQKNGLDFNLVTDKFERTTSNKGCWAQDAWGFVKDTLLSYEKTEKSDILEKIFNLKPNKFQTAVHNENNVTALQSYIDLMYNLPVGHINGKPVVKIKTEQGDSYIDKKIYDAEFKINTQLLKNVYNHTHVKGGNYFFTKNADGKEELLIGANELKKFSIDELKQMFFTDKIHIIPQADYHLDLFIRPLNNKKVLIADDEMMYQSLQKGFNKFQEAVINSTPAEREKFREPFINTGLHAMQFKETINVNPYADMKDVEKVLNNAGYETVKVPGRFYNILSNMEKDNTEYILEHSLNYLNANTLINDKNEIIYITNKSLLDNALGLTDEIKSKTGFSLQNEFLEAVKPHVDRVYFLSGKNNVLPEKLLKEQFGGIHCMSVEIPA